jgi:hypothetical protein
MDRNLKAVTCQKVNATAMKSMETDADIINGIVSLGGIEPRSATSLETSVRVHG